MPVKKIQDLRVEYSLKTFDEPDLDQNPFAQFSQWFNEALASEVNEPNAMVLATVKPDGTPSARVVLLKGIQDNGLIFFTNYESHKGEEMAQNPSIALVFCWLELQRQVRIEGKVQKISAEESDAYFLSRPVGSQIGAHASPQSREIADRAELENRYATFETLFRQEPVIRPKNWGGYIVEPSLFEFWQGRQSRLHDRFRFKKTNGGTWEIKRLAP